MATIGDIVDYRMSPNDCLTWQEEAAEDPRLSNSLVLPAVGDVQPGLVVGINEDGSLNLRVFLNGRYDMWNQNVPEGTGPGTWAARAAS